MGWLHSTTIRDIEDKGEYYKFNFSLYSKNTMIPFNGSVSYHSITNKFKDIVFVCNIRESEEEVEFKGLLHNVELVMESNMGYDKSDFYLIIPKTNLIIDSMVDMVHYDLEAIVDEDQPNLFGLWVINNRIKRAEKLKKIRQNINGYDGNEKHI